LHFPPEDNALEVVHMPNTELRVFDSPWDHCVASPGNDPVFQKFLGEAIRGLSP
jgi:homoserine O-acetyltransferase